MDKDGWKDGAAGWMLCLLCVAGGVALMFSVLNYSGFWPDEIFMTNCMRHYSEAPLGLLTFYVGHLWIEWFGYSLLNLRVLTAILSTLAVGVSSFYLYRLTRRPLLASVVFLLCCLLMKLCSFPFPNWDSFTYLFDAIAACMLVGLVARPSSPAYFILGVVSGLMTLGRLPSGILLPLAIIIVTLANRINGSAYPPARAGLLILGGWLLTMFLLTFLILGDPTLYPRLILDGNTVSGHNPGEDGVRLIRRLAAVCNKATSTCAFGAGTLVLAILFPKIHSKKLRAAILSLYVLLSLSLAYYIAQVDRQFPFILGGDAVIGLGLLLAYPVYRLFRPVEKNRLLDLQLWAVAAVLFTMMFGSDAYFERLITALVIPILIGLLWRLRLPSIHTFLKHDISLNLTVFSIITLFALPYIVRAHTTWGNLHTQAPFAGIWSEYPTVETDNLKEGIGYLRGRGERFAVVGNHQLAELIYGPLEGISFLEFHDYASRWAKDRDRLLENMDAFIYCDTLPTGIKDYAVVFDDLRRHGFTDTLKVGRSVILYRKSDGEAKKASNFAD